MSKTPYIIGRAGDITLYDDTVSRRHACLEIDGDELFLRDLDSRNGTYEIRDEKLEPFSAGAVNPDQVFAFGECVRSVAQLLSAADAAGMVLSETFGAEAAAEGVDPLDSTKIGFSIAPRKRLTSANIIEMLEQAEDQSEAGKPLGEICEGLGITTQRYQRWRTEYGATRAEREDGIAALRRENQRLRKLVADLSLEREVLKDALKNSSHAVTDPDNPASPSLSVVSDLKP